MKMKLIDGRRDERQKAEELLRARKACRYLTQSIKHMERIVAGGTIEWADEKDVVPAFVGLVRYFAYLENEELDDETNTGLKDLGNVFHSMLLLGSLLSAEKVAQLFPPEKWYDGADMNGRTTTRHGRQSKRRAAGSGSRGRARCWIS